MRPPHVIAGALVCVAYAACWPFDAPPPDQELVASWLTSVDIAPGQPTLFGLNDRCVVWLFDPTTTRLLRWSCNGHSLSTLAPSGSARTRVPALVSTTATSVALWDNQLQRIALFDSAASESGIDRTKHFDQRSIIRGFLDFSLTLFCADKYARNALAHDRVHLVLWQTPPDWLEVRQVGLVAESALPKGTETIVLSGLKGLSTFCYRNSRGEVVIAWTEQSSPVQAPDSERNDQDPLASLKAHALAERVRFEQAAFDHVRQELWLLEDRTDSPHNPRFLVTPIAAAPGERRRIGGSVISGAIESFAVSHGVAYVLTRMPDGTLQLGRYAPRE